MPSSVTASQWLTRFGAVDEQKLLPTTASPSVASATSGGCPASGASVFARSVMFRCSVVELGASGCPTIEIAPPPAPHCPPVAVRCPRPGREMLLLAMLRSEPKGASEKEW